MSRISNSFIWRKQILENESLSSTTKLVALVLHFHMNNETAECFPSEATIAKEASLSERCVVNHIKKLRKLNYISIKKVKGGLGWNRNFYKGIYFNDISLDDEVQTEESESDNKGSEYEGKSLVNDVHTNSTNNSSYNSNIDYKFVKETFERFWKEYPDHRRFAKNECYEMWLDKELYSSVDEIIKKLSYFKYSDEWRKGFVPGTLKFLKEERYEMEAVIPELMREAKDV